jgi:hypothetical protein
MDYTDCSLFWTNSDKLSGVIPPKIKAPSETAPLSSKEIVKRIQAITLPYLILSFSLTKDLNQD